MKRLMPEPSPQAKRLVWDLPLRIFHWLFGLSILAVWATAELGEEQIHIWIGYLILGLLLLRICWGIWGIRHAQFIHFIPGLGALGSVQQLLLTYQKMATILFTTIHLNVKV